MQNENKLAPQSADQPKKSVSAGRKLFTVVLVLGALLIGFLAVGVYAYPSILVKHDKPPVYEQLKTGGTSVISVMVDNRWKSAYLKKKNIQIAYQSTGSTAGLDKMLQKDIAIAFTHAPISSEKENKAKSLGGEVVQIPVVICSVVPIYNLPQLKGKKPLNFTGEILANIFLGNIRSWEHPDLLAINPELKDLGKDVKLPPITVVHREDSSGTTLIFTDYLSKVSTKWRERFPQGVSEIKEWPVGVGANRNMNVAIQTANTPGSIGYVDLLYTHLNQELELEYGAVQNHDKSAFIRANPESMTAAGRTAVSENQGKTVLEVADKAGATSYPITGVIYAICYRKQPDATRTMVVDFLRWTTHEGQDFTEKMNYAPLPSELLPRVEEQLKLIETSR